jgi:translation initiation factor IF-3
VRLSPKIGSGDFQTKLHRAVEFLEDGDRIKVTVRFRGRELSHPELGRVLLERFSKRVEEHGVVERQPVLEGKSMFIVLASTHKPKVAETPQRPARPDGGPDAPGASAPGPAAGPGPLPAAAPTPAPTQATNAPATPAPTNGAAATPPAPAAATEPATPPESATPPAPATGD